MIELQNVSFQFNKQVQVLNQASYIFHQNVFYAISGSTEAARNATFSLMIGLIEPEFGRVLFNEKNLKHSSPEEILKDYVGFHNQHSRQVEYLNVKRNIELAMDISIPRKNVNIDDVLVEFGFDEDLLEKKVSDLTPYQRFLYDIVLVVLCDKKTVLITDPTKAFNEKEINLFESKLKKLAHEIGVCVVLSTESKEIAKLADKIVVIINGKLI
ncbi:MAG: transporter ATP-binding protein [Bacillales bacterium]|jgi:ABC-type uncharacterized transport system ATPase subunit|nr:transporter ATP-binding protein [Bacillales bacterium]